MEQPNEFWMVYGIGQSPPKQKHQSEASAEREADRLARCVPGVTFVVLKTVSWVVKSDLRRGRFDAPLLNDDHIPF